MEIRNVSQIAEKNSELAEIYAKIRLEAAEASFALDILVGEAYLNEELSEKLAYDKAVILMACKNKENKKLYEDFILKTAQYRGLEKVIEANMAQITLEQSKMKYQAEGERFG